MSLGEIVEMAVEITAGLVIFALIGLFFFMAFPVIGVMLAIIAGVGIVGLLTFIIVMVGVVAVDLCQRGLKYIQDIFFN